MLFHQSEPIFYGQLQTQYFVIGEWTAMSDRTPQHIQTGHDFCECFFTRESRPGICPVVSNVMANETSVAPAVEVRATAIDAMARICTTCSVMLYVTHV